jgi:hypothetical protein
VEREHPTPLKTALYLYNTVWIDSDGAHISVMDQGFPAIFNLNDQHHRLTFYHRVIHAKRKLSQKLLASDETPQELRGAWLKFVVKDSKDAREIELEMARNRRLAAARALYLEELGIVGKGAVDLIVTHPHVAQVQFDNGRTLTITGPFGSKLSITSSVVTQSPGF